MNIKAIVKSWDLWLAIGITLLSAFLFPHQIEINAARDFYSLGIAVLSTIFSVFFAALTIIMSSTDDNFIEFLEEEGEGYSQIVATFRLTLLILFLALVFSVLAYVYTYLRSQGGAKYQTYPLLTSFEFFFLYGLFAALTSALDTISFARYRTKFLSIRRRIEDASQKRKEGPPMDQSNAPDLTNIELNSRSPAKKLVGQDEKRFDTASDVRKFEIELFWKRSLFFWGFIAAAFVAVAALKNEQPTLSLLLTQFGTVCSLAWTLGNRGSKYWQEQWEAKIEEVESRVTGPLFQVEEKPKIDGPWLRGRRYSVSRLTIAVSDSVVLLWVAIYARQIWICLAYGTPSHLPKSVIWAMSAPGILFSAALLFYGRSTPRAER